MPLLRLFAAICVAPLAAATAMAEAGVKGAANVPEPSILPGSAIFQMLFGLVGVLLLIFLIVYAIRRLSLGKGFGPKGPLRVVGGLILGTKERIVLIEVEDTWLVVGVVPGQIKTLHQMPKGETQAAQSGNAPPFSQWLKQFSERRHETNT